MGGRVKKTKWWMRTSGDFLDIVQDEVHELIVALESAGDFSAAAELDHNVLVHVLCEVEDVFFLGSCLLCAALGILCAASSTATTASTSATAAELASFRHVVYGSGCVVLVFNAWWRRAHRLDFGAVWSGCTLG